MGRNGGSGQGQVLTAHVSVDSGRKSVESRHRGQRWVQRACMGADGGHGGAEGRGKHGWHVWAQDGTCGCKWSVELVPKFGRYAHEQLTCNDCLKLGDEFCLKRFAGKETFPAILTSSLLAVHHTSFLLSMLFRINRPLISH